MILYIAEKPSLGRALAEALPRPLKKGDGFIQAANGDVVSWCIGHLLEQADPESYNSLFKKWSHDTLPIVPDKWLLKAKKETSKQLAILKKWIKEADHLVHAGDPDREGQLLVDEVIDFVGIKDEKKNNVQRCLISDLNLPAIQRSLANLRSNRDFIPLSVSALARSRADWLYGINLTRAYTLQGQKVGYQGVLSVGRVQTPLLGLVVKRDAEIAAFTSVAFYNVWANIVTLAGESFRAKWIPSENCTPYLDSQRRNLSKSLAENVVRRVSFQPANIDKIDRNKKTWAAPLPYSLSALQIDANKTFGFSAQDVLTICQGLYERHKAITYPRSDSRHLPMAHFDDANIIVRVIADNLEKVDSSGALSQHENNASLFSSLNLQHKSKAWNDAKVDAHHAIIPTQKILTSLSPQESKIYRLICRNYIAQFLPHHIFYESRIELTIAAGKFVAKAKEIEQEGWKPLFQSKKKSTTAKNDGNTPEHDNDEERDNEQTLPLLTLGETLESKQAQLEEKHTSPPKHFTDATLLAAMTGINAFVKDINLKKILKDTDGLGTEATRAGIIELLIKRGFMLRQAKNIKASDAGKALIDALPESITLPDRTAQWESILTNICDKKAKYGDLMYPLISELVELTKQSQNILPSGLKGLPSKSAFAKRRPSKANSKTTKRRINAKPTTVIKNRDN